MKAKTDKRKNNGGAREGAGRPKKDQPATVTVAFRVFDHEAEYVKEMVKQLLKKKRNGYV